MSGPLVKSQLCIELHGGASEWEYARFGKGAVAGSFSPFQGPARIPERLVSPLCRQHTLTVTSRRISPLGQGVLAVRMPCFSRCTVLRSLFLRADRVFEVAVASDRDQTACVSPRHIVLKRGSSFPLWSWLSSHATSSCFAPASCRQRSPTSAPAQPVPSRQRAHYPRHFPLRRRGVLPAYPTAYEGMGKTGRPSPDTSPVQKPDDLCAELSVFKLEIVFIAAHHSSHSVPCTFPAFLST
jgi:hypothetical protein